MSVIYDPTGGRYEIGDLTESDVPSVPRALDAYPVDAHELQAGTKIHVGTGLSTALPDMDFETYSEAGFYFDQDRGRWVSLAGPGKKGGLSVVGSVVYAQHPSTEVLSLAYNLKDGRGERMWLPGCPPPVDLFAHIARGGLIEAFNAAFEYYIWLHVCQERMGWPALPISTLVDAMAKSRAFAFPGKLENAARVSGANVQKQEHGQRLIKKFSVPRSPTKKDDRRRIRPEEDTTDGPLFYEYNIFDIRAEAAVSAHCPDLQPEEHEFWRHTMAMNARGVGVDHESVASCIEIIEQAHERYNAELRQLTNGTVGAASESAKLKTWLAVAHNLQISSLDEAHRKTYLDRPDLPAPARRAIEIVDLIGSAGVKKVYAMARMRAQGDRLHELYVYHGAHTGRDTGRDVQPTNLVKAGVNLKWCGDVHCRRSFGQHLSQCPWCGASGAFSKSTGWRWEACDDVLAVIRTNSLDTVEHYYGDALLAISGCIRGLLVAEDGRDLICSDYSSIEAVVTAVLAGEQWRIDAFRRGDDIYLRGAASVTGKSYEEYQAYKGRTGEKHPDRQEYGKPAELGCFGPQTQVLTDRGYLAMVDVLTTDKVWDGTEWVTHQGVISQGIKETMLLDGVRITPDHLVNLSGFWKEAKQLGSSPRLLRRALVTGLENLPRQGKNGGLKRGEKFKFDVAAVPTRIGCHFRTFGKALAHGVAVALEKLPRRIVKSGLVTPDISRTKATAAVCSIGCQPLSPGAITPTRDNTLPMVDGGYTFSPGGVITGAPFYSTCKLFLDGMTRRYKWTAQTILEATSRAISALLRLKKITQIVGPFVRCKKNLTHFEPVYDIVNAGPRNRFTIKTGSGHLLVHNCGFGGWITAWRQFDDSDTFTDDQVKQNILAWRAASPNIVEMWGGQVRGKPWAPDRHELYGFEGAAIAAIQNPGATYHTNGIGFGVRGRDLFVQLPSGRFLTYHNARLVPSDRWEGQVSIIYEGWNSNPTKGPMGWIEINTYGGRLAENIIQATARDILRHAVNLLEKAGYPVVMRTYDEIISEVPHGYGSVEEFETLMATLPVWAAGWPIRATGGWRGKRYRKD